MISVDEALNRILSFIDVLEAVPEPLLNCLGRVLAEDIYAPFDVPQYDNSAMDGYAVQAVSIKGATQEKPQILRVIGTLAAGHVADLRVGPGMAVRIMTGAIIPYGADTVVPFELTDEAKVKHEIASGDKIGVFDELPQGANVRRSGEDMCEGELVMEHGRLLRPAEIGVLASLGKSVVSVVRRPVIGILATGDEVMDIAAPLLPAKIYNSNTYSLAAQVMKYGGIPKVLGIAKDEVRQLSAAVRSGLDCDMVITSGGVSLGDYDVVKRVLAAEGDISFWTVCMKPGKPLAFGTFRRNGSKKVPHLGLPGNPVSSMITFEVFARPAILKMMGRKNLTKQSIKAVIADTVLNNDGRRIFARVAVEKQEGKYFARLTGAQGSGILTSMARANGLAVIYETTKMVNSGDVVEVIMLDWDEAQG